MGRFRQLILGRPPRQEARPPRRRATYANITATIALFLGLSGVSYAAFTLPPGSVGAPQLQPGAVGPRALGVALGAEATVERQPYEIAGSCTQGTTGGVAPPCAPQAPTTVTVAHVFTQQPGLLLVSALATMVEAGPPGELTKVTLWAAVDGVTLPGQSAASVAASQSVQIPYQSSLRVGAGEHRVALKVGAADHLGTLRVQPVSLNAVVLPPAG